MAQKFNFYVTAIKVVTPDGKIMNYPDGKLWGVIANNEVIATAVGEDTLMITQGGFQLTIQEEFADVQTDLSATDISGS